MGIRVNQGYRIIETVRIDTSLEVVMAQSESKLGSHYVTWQCKNGTDYYWGHYFDDCDAARRDLFKRVLGLLPESDDGGDEHAAE